MKYLVLLLSICTCVAQMNINVKLPPIPPTIGTNSVPQARNTISRAEIEKQKAEAIRAKNAKWNDEPIVINGRATTRRMEAVSDRQWMEAVAEAERERPLHHAHDEYLEVDARNKHLASPKARAHWPKPMSFEQFKRKNVCLK